jgi:hypothetical protein
MTITRITREAWREWMTDRGQTEKSREATCDACGRTITIGKVAAFVPSVDDKPVELICETCTIDPPTLRAEESIEISQHVEAEQLISRMLHDGLITRTKDGTIKSRTYGREALMLLSTLTIREAQGEPNRAR